MLRLFSYSSRRLSAPASSPIFLLHHFLSNFIPDDLSDPPFTPTSKPRIPNKTKKKTSQETPFDVNDETQFPLKSGLPFDFKYSYSETNPSVKPISFRESPKFSPFGPGRLDRKWTGTSAPVRGDVGLQKWEEERKRILGEPLSEEEVAELVEQYRHSDCARQINLGISKFLEFLVVWSVMFYWNVHFLLT